MNPTLSGPRWTLACLALCLAGASGGFLRAQPELSLTLAVTDLPELPSPSTEIGQAIDEQEQRIEQERLYRMRFFQAIAANDKTTLRRMLNEGMDPDAELPFPVPAEFQKCFTDSLLRYYVAGEEGFTGLMLATALGNHTFVKILLLAGADPWKLTKRHKTYALWLAAKYRNIEIMRSLMGIGPGHPSEAFRITIDLSTQTASLWRNGKIILATPISSGRPSHPTPPGRYLVTDKYRQWKSTLYPARMPFFLRLSCGDFGLHMGALPGYPASHGCIRLPENSARKLYASVPVGTLVEIR
ncbi:MAG TPA: L,D-transpeptidase family protein [Terrimicrobiaceae bacterium]|nr:L,D-transpeptidase family protein [Terrimicrobiaceae bacterium]